MPAPLIIGALAAAAGAVGIIKGAKGISDSSEADYIQNSAEDILNKANEELTAKKENANKIISNLGKLKIEVWTSTIKEFVDVYSQIHNVNLTEKKVMKNYVNWDFQKHLF